MDSDMCVLSYWCLSSLHWLQWPAITLQSTPTQSTAIIFPLYHSCSLLHYFSHSATDEGHDLTTIWVPHMSLSKNIHGLTCQHALQQEYYSGTKCNNNQDGRMWLCEKLLASSKDTNKRFRCLNHSDIIFLYIYQTNNINECFAYNLNGDSTVTSRCQHTVRAPLELQLCVCPVSGTAERLLNT